MRAPSLLAAIVVIGCGSTEDASSGTGATGVGGAVASASASGGGATGGLGGGSVDACHACGAPADAGTVAVGGAVELSGIAASAIHPGVFYVHNDSGDKPRFFAVGAAGEDLGTFEVTGATAVDWEDAARGPCPAGSCVYFADIGDNNEARSDYVIYRVPEPTELAGGVAAIAGEAFPVEYPDGSHNAETLLVHPMTGDVTVVTKRASGASSIFELAAPLTPDRVGTFTEVGALTPPEGSAQFTGGDVHPLATGVLLRTYTHLFYYAMAPGQTVAEALASEPCSVPVAGEPQGEAVAWTAAGDGYVTVSEGDMAALHAVQCGR